MIVYVYDKKSNVKVDTIKNVFRVASNEEDFKIHTEKGIESVPKKGIKLVVYGF